ncbi:MAG: hypothetical protein ACREIV_11765, partial [Planctomycetaceae bacterium]
LGTGETAIVCGGRDGIEFSLQQVKRLFVHTHPYSRPATGCASRNDMQAIGALRQRRSYILEHGVLFRFSPWEDREWPS